MTNKKYTTTEAQRRAKAKWQKKNREKASYYTAKSTAKRFITKLANDEDLEEITQIVKEIYQKKSK